MLVAIALIEQAIACEEEHETPLGAVCAFEDAQAVQQGASQILAMFQGS